jgi:hypothetical protein
VRDAARLSRAPAASLAARAAADAALATTERHWRPEWAFALPVGGAHRETVSTAAGPADVVLLRLDRHRFLLTAEARARTGAAGGAREAVRRTGRWLRLARVLVDAPAALTAGGPVVAPPGARLAGADAAPPGWTCPATGAAAPDLAVADTLDAADVEPDALASPSVAVTAAARDDARWDALGDDTWNGLAARAAVVVPAGAELAPTPREETGRCVVDAAGWGEPRRGATAVTACTQTAPVVHLRGPGVTRLRGPARMQGVLLVDGDLEVVGDVEVAGVVLVRGALHAANASLRVTGALLVRQRAPATPGVPAVTLGAGSSVAHSPCAVEAVTLAASRVMPLGRRAAVTVTPAARE